MVIIINKHYRKIIIISLYFMVQLNSTQTVVHKTIIVILDNCQFNKMYHRSDETFYDEAKDQYTTRRIVNNAKHHLSISQQHKYTEYWSGNRGARCLSITCSHGAYPRQWIPSLSTPNISVYHSFISGNDNYSVSSPITPPPTTTSMCNTDPAPRHK